MNEETVRLLQQQNQILNHVQNVALFYHIIFWTPIIIWALWLAATLYDILRELRNVRDILQKTSKIPSSAQEQTPSQFLVPSTTPANFDTNTQSPKPTNQPSITPSAFSSKAEPPKSYDTPPNDLDDSQYKPR